MRSSLLSLTSTMPASEAKRLSDGWLLDCQYRQLSDATIAKRRVLLSKWLWWLKESDCDQVGSLELKQFLAYVSRGHTDEEGRWGKGSYKKAVRPSTVKEYYITLKTFFRWLVEEGFMESSPMEGLKAPTARADQITPFNEDQVKALLAAARESKYPRRDEAILLFLLDTGMRCSELCGLTLRDLDLIGKQAVVLGKGNKHRSVYFSRTTARAINVYLRSRGTLG